MFFLKKIVLGTRVLTTLAVLPLAATGFGQQGASQVAANKAVVLTPQAGHPRAALSVPGKVTAGSGGYTITVDHAKTKHMQLKLSPVTPASAESKNFSARIKRDQQAFIENRGQWDRQATYLARSENMRVWLLKQGWLVDVFKTEVHGKLSGTSGQVIKMAFSGGNPSPALIPTAWNGSVRDYMSHPGQGPLKGVKAYGQVLAREVYPGIDVNSYIEKGRPRFDVVVRPGADPSLAKLHFEGAKVALTGKGELAAQTTIGELKFGDLKAFQFDHGVPKAVKVAFTELGGNDFGFQVSDYDKSKELTIDPVAYGTYYGADDGWDEVHGVTTDTTGGVYLTGFTQSPGFPKVSGPYGFALHSNRDAFITKLQGDVYSHDYAAIFGGVGDDSGDWIAVDPNGDVWVAGLTRSEDFPGNTSRHQVNLNGDGSQIATNGTFEIDYFSPNGSVTAVTLPYNATSGDVQAALQAQIDPGILVTGSSMPTGSMTIDAPNPVNGAWSVDSSGTQAQLLGGDFATELSLNTTDLLAPDTGTVTAGTYTIMVPLPGGTVTTAAVAYNAPPATVLAALQAAVGGGTTVTLNPIAAAGIMPASSYAILFTGQAPTGSLSVNSSALVGGTYKIPATDSWVLTADPARSLPTSGYFGLTVLGQTVPQNQTPPEVRFNTTAAKLQPLLTALANVGANLFVQTAPGPISLPTGALVIETVGTLAGTTTGPFGVFVDNSTLAPRPVFSMFTPASAFVMRWKNTGLGGFMSLDPEVGNEKSFVFQSSSVTDVAIAGFAIRKNLDGAGNVVIDLAGETYGSIPAIVAGATPANVAYQGQASYLMQLTANNSVPAVDTTMSRYIGEGIPAVVQGLALDANGDVYIGGTVVNFSGTLDTTRFLGPWLSATTYAVGDIVMGSDGLDYVSLNAGNLGNDPTLGGGQWSFASSQFQTYPAGVLSDVSTGNPRLLRGSDLFIRKYGTDGSLIFSALVGGDGNDFAGGLAMLANGEMHNVGSCVAVDLNGNAYITGISNSFNFPRTRSAFGQVFSQNPLMTVTKVSADGLHVLYSTNLKNATWDGSILFRTNHDVAVYAVEPAGIGVDSVGNAFVTGNIRPVSMDFPHPVPYPTDLTTVRPSGQTAVSIQTTANAVQTGAGAIGSPDMATQDGWMNVLSPDASTLIYGTYIGGNLDEEVRGPYMDHFGDCWVFGFTDAARTYWRTLPRTIANRITVRAALPTGFITDLAFKVNADEATFGNGILNGVQYGSLDRSPEGPVPPFTIDGVNYGRDGFVVRFRVTTPVVTGVTFNFSDDSKVDPLGAATTECAGGAGEYVWVNVTISQAAPLGGMTFKMSLSDPSIASWDPVLPIGDHTISIQPGNTTSAIPNLPGGGHYDGEPLWLRSVTQPTDVDVTADFVGDFHISRLTVVPWLKLMTLLPSSVVGGTPFGAQIRLTQPDAAHFPIGAAPEPGKFDVLFTSDNTAVVPANVIMPVESIAQSTPAVVQPTDVYGPINLQTNGVDAPVVVNIKATALGFSVQQPVTVIPPSLSGVTFDPPSVDSGSISTGTVTLTGPAVTQFDVKLVCSNPNYTFLPSDTITFTKGSKTQMFTLQTSFEAQNVSQTVTATRVDKPADHVSGTLFVLSEDVKTLVLNPSTVNGGSPSVASVTMTTAPIPNGAIVTVSSSDAGVTLRQSANNFQQSVTLTVPVGAINNAIDVPIRTTVITSAIDVTISASVNGGVPVTAVLHVNSVGASVTLNPSTVSGGTQSNGTVTLSAPAPLGGGGISVALSVSGPGSGAVNSMVPNPVVVPAGSKTAPFVVSTFLVPSVEVATISAQVGTGALGSANLTILPPAVIGLSFKSPRIRGGAGVIDTLTVSFSATPPAGGKVYFTGSNTRVTPFPMNLPTDGIGHFAVIPAGLGSSTTMTLAVPVLRVSRVLASTITATYSGKSFSTLLTDTR